ncbi:MAG: hypothetical protein ACPGXY_01000 [Alphaproteobacteria bacterium]
MYKLPLVIFLGLVVLFWIMIDKDDPRHPMVGKRVQEIGLMLEKGEPYLLHIFEPDSYQSRLQVPTIKALMQDVKVYGVQYKSSVEAGQVWQKAQGLQYQDVIWDRDGSISVNLGVVEPAELYIISSDGVISAVLSEEVMPKNIDAIKKMTE